MRHRNRLNILPAVWVLGCALFLSACGVRVTVESPYWYTKALDGRYPLTLKVEKDSNATIDAVEVTVSGQSSPMAGTGQTRTFTVQQGGAEGMRVAYQVRYTAPGFLVVPQQSVNRHPNVGELQIPILDPDSDIDADGWKDRDDNCPFHPNPGQEMGPTYTNTNTLVRIGAVCDAQAPGLRHITVTQTTAPYVTRMRDNTGNRMLTEGGRSYYAFRTLVSSKGQVTELQVDGVSPVGKTVEIANCNLVYQDGDGGLGGNFVEVYAAESGYNCSFAMKSGDRDLVTGSEVIIVVVSRVDPDVHPLLRNARMFGRVTLRLPPQDGPQDALDIFHRLTANSPANYAYFYIPKFASLSDVGTGRDPSVEADFRGDAEIVFRP